MQGVVTRSIPLGERVPDGEAVRMTAVPRPDVRRSTDLFIICSGALVMRMRRWTARLARIIVIVLAVIGIAAVIRQLLDLPPLPAHGGSD